MKQITVFIFITIVFMLQCKEPAPLDIQPLKIQGDAFKIVSMIPKDSYKTNDDYQTGYQNGRILSDRLVEDECVLLTLRPVFLARCLDQCPGQETSGHCGPGHGVRAIKNPACGKAK